MKPDENQIHELLDQYKRLLLSESSAESIVDDSKSNKLWNLLFVYYVKEIYPYAYKDVFKKLVKLTN